MDLQVWLRRPLPGLVAVRIKPVLVKCLLVMAVIAALPEGGTGQIKSNVTSVALTRPLVESLTVSVAPSTATFNLVAGGTAAGSAPVAITTTWTMAGNHTTVDLYGSFASATAALTDGAGHKIASADVLGQVTTGLPTTFTAFTQVGPFGASGASLELFSQAITAANENSQRTDDLNLEINLSSIPQLPAATYRGTLHIRAQGM